MNNEQYPFQLIDVRLYEVEAKRTETPPDVDAVGAKGDITSTPVNIETEILRFEDSNRLSVRLTLQFSDAATEAPDYTLRFTLEGLFESLVDMDRLDDAFWQEFEQTSAITLLWPYAREYAQNLTQRMRVDVLMLPTLTRSSVAVPTATEP